MNLTVALPEDLVDAIVERATELVIARMDARGRADELPAYMTPHQAAVYLGCEPRRIYDLRSQRRLTPFTEGGRALVKRSELDGLVVVDEISSARKRAA